MKKKSPSPRLRVLHVRDVKRDLFKKLVIRDVVRKPFLGDLSLVHLRLPPRTRLPNIVHRRTSEFIYCLSGAMTGVLGGRTFRLRGGSILFIPPGVWHKFSTQSKACEALALFHPSLAISRYADIHGEPGVRLWD